MGSTRGRATSRRGGAGGSGGASRGTGYWSRGGAAGAESAANGAELDVGVLHGGASLVLLDVGGDTGGGGARTTSGARLGAIDGEGRVEPEHIGRMVVPQTHDQNHRGGNGLGHGSKTTTLVEDVVVAESHLLSLAESRGDGVARVTRDGRLRVRDDLYFDN